MIEVIQLPLRKRAKRSLRAKKPKKTIVSLWREWNVPDGAYRRYPGLKGIYWYWLSRFIRERDWKAYGTCLTCLDAIEDWRTEDCGHVLASHMCGGFLRFHQINLCLQHKKCNNPKFRPDAGVRNAVNIDARYGAGTMKWLLYHVKADYKEPNKAQWEEMIRALPSYPQKNANDD